MKIRHKILLSLVFIFGLFFVISDDIYAKVECIDRFDCESYYRGTCIGYNCEGVEDNCLCKYTVPDTNLDNNSETDENDQVVINTDGDWLDKIFPDGSISLNIFNPSKFEGQASFWSLVGWFISLLFPIAFLASIAFIAIGTIKYVSSNGEDAKVQSARKYIKNAVLGFVSTIVFFIGANLILIIFGFGNLFDFAQNVAVCEDKALYEYKRDNPTYLDSDDCTCTASGWSCTAP